MTAREGWLKAWSVNVVGAYAMTQTFLPLLIKSTDPRLLFITSGLSSLTIASDVNHPRYQIPPAGLPKPNMGQMSYKSSKAGLNMMMVEWHRILQKDGVKVWSIAPGLLATGLGGNREFLKQIGAGNPSIGTFPWVERSFEPPGGLLLRETPDFEASRVLAKLLRRYNYVWDVACGRWPGFCFYPACLKFDTYADPLHFCF
jgi:NAD(P)-dependent dehydrogenase (short-subunit alcohol dehydrogenase family)